VRRYKKKGRWERREESHRRYTGWGKRTRNEGTVIERCRTKVQCGGGAAGGPKGVKKDNATREVVETVALHRTKRMRETRGTERRKREGGLSRREVELGKNREGGERINERRV